MHVTDLHRRSVEGFAARVDALDGLSPERWAGPTPCADWDVRALLNHIVYEDLWTVPLMEGATIAEVGDRYEGDLLGDDPLAAAHAAVRHGGDGDGVGRRRRADRAPVVR